MILCWLSMIVMQLSLRDHVILKNGMYSVYLIVNINSRLSSDDEITEEHVRKVK